MNCTFFNNTAVQGALYLSNGGAINAVNCIFWDSGADGGGIWRWTTRLFPRAARPYLIALQSGGRPPFDRPTDMDPRLAWKRTPISRAASTCTSTALPFL